MEKFLAAVRNMFQVPDLRRRILFTLGILAIYRLGAHVSAPGINKARLDQVWHDVSGTLLGVLDLFSGGNFRLISVFALGVTPYITSSIILQLMTVVSPQLKKLQEEGEMGRAKINQWTRYLTVGLAGLQTTFVAHWSSAGWRPANNDAFEAEYGRRNPRDLCFVGAFHAAELVLCLTAEEPRQLVRKDFQLLPGVSRGRSILRTDLSVADRLLHVLLCFDCLQC